MARKPLGVVLLLVAASCDSADEQGGGGTASGPGGASTAGDAGDATGVVIGRFHFTDLAARNGLTVVNHVDDPEHMRYALEGLGNGCALLDHDGDGDLDLYVVDSCSLREEGSTMVPAMDGNSRFYENDGSGRFTDVTEETGTAFGGFGVGASAVDYDGDGDVDLYVTCWGPNLLFRNDGTGRFTEVGAAAGVADPRWGVGSCWLDCEGDGDLDLYVANYFSMDPAVDPDCWRKVDCPFFDLKVACGPKGMVPEADVFFLNNGDGTFTEASDRVAVGQPYSGLGAVAFDFDQDGDMDILVGNDSRGNFLFENDGTGHFEDVADLVGVSLNRDGIAQASMGIACGDCDGDGDPDLFVTNFSHDNHTLYRNDGVQGFLDVTLQWGFREDMYFALGWGTEFADFDNDGVNELFVANGHIYPEADQRAPELTFRQLNRLYTYHDGSYRDVTGKAGPGMAKVASTRGAAVGDVDNDGDLDLVLVEQGEPPTLLINGGSFPGRSLLVSLEGRACNRAAVGAAVTAVVGGKRLFRELRAGHSYASSNDPRLHFGTGDASVVERLEVRWPDGSEQVWEDLPTGRRIHLVQGRSEVEEKAP